MTGDRLPEITYLVKVAEHFHVSLDWLVGLSGDKYELMPPELQEVASLYGAANADEEDVGIALLADLVHGSLNLRTESEGIAHNLLVTRLIEIEHPLLLTHLDEPFIHPMTL